jgi:hypothetical protein
MIVPDVLISSLSNKTSTSQPQHRNDGAAAHSSYLTRRQILHATNAECRISALQAVLNGLRSETHRINLGPEKDYELSKIDYPEHSLNVQ